MRYPLTPAEQVVVVMMAGFAAGIIVGIPFTFLLAG